MPFSQNITPTILDARWGPDHHCRVDVLQHATRIPEGNPVLVIRHGGGGMTSDKREPWVAGGAFNVLANWLHQQTALPFDVWSIATPQSHYGSPVSAAHLSTTYNDRLTRPVLFPESVEWLKFFFQWANRYAVGGDVLPETGATLGHKAGDYIAAGREFGALLQAVAAFSGPHPPATTNGQLLPGGRFAPYGTSSAVKGLVLLDLITDVRAPGGIEQVYWSAMQGLFGTYGALNEWQRVPASAKAAASPIAYVQRGETRHVLPQYLVQQGLGNHLKPYGDPATGAGADVRDSDQHLAYVAALNATAPVLPFTAELIVASDWETEVNGAALSSRVFNWARTVLNR